MTEMHARLVILFKPLFCVHETTLRIVYFPFHLRHLKPEKKTGHMKSVTTMHIYLFLVAIAAIIVEKL